MLYSAIIAVCTRSEIHTKHRNALSGQNIQVFNVKDDDTWSNNWALKG